MIIWSTKLFLGDSIKEKKLKKIRKKIEKPDKIRFGAYLITLNTNGSDLLDIYNIMFFPAKHFKKKDYDVKIVGVAGGADEAQELAGGMIARFLKEGFPLTPDGIRGYFKECF